MEPDSLYSKKIVLGVTGSIAIYKSAELIRLLKKAGCEVQVVATNSSKEFIAPLTFQTLSGRPVYNEMFNNDTEFKIGHISIARWADLILIAPASANIIAKMANGIADDLLSTICLASKVPIAVAPGMNEAMWENPATQENVSKLLNRGVKIIGPNSGFQACGEIGNGRMSEPKEIVESIEPFFLPQILKNKKIMITAGPTIEPIDPARYISNYSSGKMGYAIADIAQKMGAVVTLVSGHVHLEPIQGINLIKVKTANEMYNAVMDNIENIDIFIGSAAVADYRLDQPFVEKLKKSEDSLTLKLVKNPDILNSVSKLNKVPVVVGFSAETTNLEENALMKLNAKKIDIIAGNLVGENKGFNSEENELILMTKNGVKVKLDSKPKKMLAKELLLFISDYHKEKFK